MTELQYPRVELLRYCVELLPNTRIQAGAELAGEIGPFKFRLSDGFAEFTPLTHFASEAEAREQLDPKLRSWEIQLGLSWQPNVMLFRFQNSRVAKAPPSPGSMVIQLESASMVMMGESVNLVVTRSNYPPPPTDFAADDSVRTLAELYFLALNSPSVVLYLGYSFLSLTEAMHGGPKFAAKNLAVSAKVLEAIARLTNTRGTGIEARKHVANQPKQSLAPSEREWLMRVFKELVIRAGRLASGAPPGPELTLADFPLPAK